MLRPFWRYFGGKWRAAPRYPFPRHATIIEPFAGAAGYSMRYPHRRVILVEKYHVVAEIWRWLIGASEAEILSVPCVEAVDDLPAGVAQGARWLVGFSLNAATAHPCNVLSAGRKRMAEMGRNFEGWNEAKRAQVASQVRAIRHWQVIEGDYTEAPDLEATWFVDPPYRTAGHHYVHGSDTIDYAVLGAWCQSRRGQVIACEADDGADWLPFRRLGGIRGFGRDGADVSQEAIWTSDPRDEQPALPWEAA